MSDKGIFRTSSTPSIVDVTPDRGERPRKLVRSVLESPSQKDVASIVKIEQTPSRPFFNDFLKKRITDSLNERPNLLNKFMSAQDGTPSKSTGFNERSSQLVSEFTTTEDIANCEETTQVLPPRLVVYELRLTNFKSYAGTQIVGPFHPSFSSIVGPNGSGKSNVIDALLFVFGFRASKLRQSKASALIHKSATHPSLDSCDVEITFKEVNSDFTYVDGSELTVRRTAYKNNTSKYFVNGVESSFSAVSNLLKEKGIDLNHKRFLILQGEVESIAQMKPRAISEGDDGLLEYLEDIIGTSKYKPIIEENMQALSNSDDICAEKESRLKLVLSEKAKLEDSKNSVLSFLKDENELFMKQNLLYRTVLYETRNKKTLVQNLLNSLEGKLQAHLEKFEQTERDISEKNEEVKSLREKAAKVKNDCTSEKKTRQSYEQQTVKIEEQLKFLLNKEKKLKKSIEALSFEKSEAENSLSSHDIDSQKLNSEIADLSLRLQQEELSLDDIRKSLQGKTEGISNAIEEKQKAMAPALEKINQLTSEKQILQVELDMLLNKENDLINDVESSQSSLDKLRNDAEENRNILSSKLKVLSDLKGEKKDVSKNIERKKETVHNTYRNLMSNRTKLEEMKASLSSSRSRGNVLESLQRLHESDNLNGFFGRLGDLATIDEAYDVAISTACPALNHIVVDNIETGQKCVAFLRSNNLGRASFIILKELAQKNLARIQTPENVPRLFDLLRFNDQKFAPAFYNVLQNTLVAKNLEQANRIAYGKTRWRVVTLSGQLIDKSGTMTGGGTRVKKGGMSSAITSDVSPASVETCDKQVQLEDTRYRQHLSELESLNQRFTEISERIPSTELEISKLQLDVSACDRLVAGEERRILQLKSDLKSIRNNNERKRNLQNKISNMDKEVEAININNEGLVTEIKALQDKIMEIGGIRYRIQKSKVDDLHEQLKFVKDKLNKMSFKKKKNEQRSQSFQVELSNLTSEYDTTTESIATLKTELQSLNKYVDEHKSRLREFENALWDINSSIDELVKFIEFESKQMNSVKAERIELENQIQEQRTALSEVGNNENKYLKLMSNLKLHNLTEFCDQTTMDSTFPEYSEDELSSVDKSELVSNISVLKKKTEDREVDINVLSEYRRCNKEAEKRDSDYQSELQKRTDLKKVVTDLQSQRLDEFMYGFGIISMKLKEMYQIITMGGNAELELVDSLDPFSEGVLFSVMPPKKSWKNISNLSGGEKTLSSLALVFALHNYKPTPLYVMDEIDAALDFKNVSIVANYIKERTKNAQFIVISLRSNMFELSSRLVGIYKTANMTKSVTINNKEILTD
ncbi:Structural maintenance of chromosomes protein [Schizosaccharomyces pombe]